MKRLVLTVALLSVASAYTADRKTISDSEEYVAFIEASIKQNSWMPAIGDTSAISRYDVADTPFDADLVAVVYKGDAQDLQDAIFSFNRQFHMVERNAYKENGTNYVEYVMQCPSMPNGMPMMSKPHADMLVWRPVNPFRGGNRYGGVWHWIISRIVYLKRQ